MRSTSSIILAISLAAFGVVLIPGSASASCPVYTGYYCAGFCTINIDSYCEVTGACKVNVESYCNGTCTVNVLAPWPGCHAGGNCLVNVEAECDGGQCTINAVFAYCGPGWNCLVNVDTVCL